MNLPDRRSLALLGVAIMAIASSAVLVRWAEAPAIALAFWRTLGGSLVLATRRRPADTRPRPSRATTLAIVGAGLALAVHFSSWLASLEMTSVAASVTLVSTAPIGVALLQWGAGGDRPDRRNWLVIAVTLLGVAVIAGGDIGTSSDELAGDALALLGAVAMAVYLVLGGRARTGTVDDRLRRPGLCRRRCCAPANRTRHPDAALGLRRPDLARHRRHDPPGPNWPGTRSSISCWNSSARSRSRSPCWPNRSRASVLTWLLFAETPPLAAWIGAPIVLTGLALHLLWASGQDVTTSRRAASSS
ncbi:MAG: DMT family transporter [Acidimicrobiales bacterium]